MTVTTEINESKNLIMHHFSGCISLSILLSTIKKTLLHPKYRPGMNTIWSCDDDTKVEMSTEDVHKVSELARESFDKNGLSYRLALVASDDLAFGMSRVYEGWNSDRGILINSFRNMDDALEWIKD